MQGAKSVARRSRPARWPRSPRPAYPCHITGCPSTRPWRWSRSPLLVVGSMSWSDRPGLASPPRWPGCVPCGKPSTGRARCSALPPLPPLPKCSLASSASTPKNSAKWLHEHRREAERLGKISELRNTLRSLPNVSRAQTPFGQRISAAVDEVALWRLSVDQLVIVDEASLAGTFALDELVRAATTAGAKVVLVGDQAQLSSVDAGGMFATLGHAVRGSPRS